LFESYFSVPFLASESGLGVYVFIDLFGQLSLFCLKTLDHLEENFLGDHLISGLEGHWGNFEELLRVFFLSVEINKLVHGTLRIIFDRVTAVAANVLETHGVQIINVISSQSKTRFSSSHIIYFR